MFLLGCSFNIPTQSILDVSKPQTITLKDYENVPTSSSRIWIWGKISGKADISIIVNDEVYYTETVSGKVNISWHKIWGPYRHDKEEAEILYQPKAGVSGNIKIKYDFARDLWPK